MRKKTPVSAKNLKGFREADQIIAFMEDMGETTLPASVRANYERYCEIHSMLARYKQHSAIIGFLKDRYQRTERQARYDIGETQYIFGKVIQVNRNYEKAYLLELSRKNLELAMNTRNPKLISQAIITHKDLLGPEEVESDAPDFSALEPHRYSIVLPEGLPKILMDLLNSGAIDLSEIIPSSSLMLDKDIEDAEVVE